MKINGFKIKPGADLEGVNLEGADLRGGDLEGADLRRVNLRRANLKGVNLEGADLRGADLRRVNLRRVNFEGADLRRVNLEGADLEGADLRGADLDFSSGVPFHCGGTKIIIDDRIASQILFHATRQDYSQCSGGVQEAIEHIKQMAISDLFCEYRKDVDRLE